MKKALKPLLGLLIMLMVQGLISQNTVKGTVTDGDTGETLIGVNILVAGTVRGTITNVDGTYELSNNEPLPYTLQISFIGYETQNIEVTDANATVDVVLALQAVLSSEVVVSASRVEESILESPVTIEKLDLIAIRQSTSADYYDEITRLKGVQSTQASLTFTSINARGFSGHGNTRFVQLQDGIDNAAPLLNFPTGNIVGISELDIKNMELIPGAASALYGPNAFNGILLMNSKDPFNYQGLSAQIKSGYTDGAFNSDPMYGGSIRYAKAINDKFAFKINVSALKAKDWDARDYTGQRSPGVLGNLNPGDAAFDGINTYGDESLIPVGTGLKRTGWLEEDLLDNRDAESFKYDAAFHYRLSDNLEANVSYKYGSGSTVYQGSERYALRDFVQQFAKFELNAANWNIRAYRSMTDDGDSYNMTALGAFVNEGIFPTIYNTPLEVAPGVVLDVPGGWAVAANLANQGALNLLLGIPGGDINAAKNFADAGGTSLLSAAQKSLLIPGLAAQLGVPLSFASLLVEQAGGGARPDANSQEFKDLVNQVRTGLFQQGGAGFIDDSNLNHIEGNYNLSSLFDDKIGLQVGANYRQYDLFTMGTIFNEDPDGDGVFERIKIGEYGGYMQLTKKFADEKLKFTGSLRYDKNENFDGQVTPRVSLVYSLGESRNHNFRASYQTGFRNPTTQGQFIYFPTTNILLGGTRANAERYGIFEGGAWSEDSYLRFLQSGNDSDLQTITLDYVQPEKLSSVEFGYKGITNRKLFIDANVYYSIYKDFITQDNVISKEDTEHQGTLLPAGTTFRPYFNAPIDIDAYGFTAGLEYIINKNWKVTGNYTYNDFSFDKANLPSGFEGFDPGFNTPTSKINLGVFNRKFLKNLSFGANFKYQNEFFWFGSFGEGVIPAFSTIDAQVSYRINSAKTNIKAGVNNLLKKEFVTNYGGPTIGRIFHITLTYDQYSN
jgi:outer membrane cobalamin receptor